MAKVSPTEPKILVLSIDPLGNTNVNALYLVNLSEGHNEIVLQGLPASVVPGSLNIDDERTGGEGTLVLDRTTVLPPTETLEDVDALLKGLPATLYFGEKGTEEISGTIRLKQGSIALIQTDDGLRRVEKIVGYTLPQTPEGLTDTPYLSLTVTVEKAGEYQLMLTYDMTEIAYSLLHEVTYNERISAFTNWRTSVIVSNGSGTPFQQAQLYIVAGNLGKNQSDNSRGEAALEGLSFSAVGGAKAAMRQPATSESLGGNAVSYMLPKPADLPAGSKTKASDTKLTLLQSTGNIEVKRVNRVGPDGQWWTRDGTERESKAAIEVSFVNTEDNHLGKRIPRAPVAFWVRNKEGYLQPSGGDTLADTAIDHEVELSPGKDFDIIVKRRPKTHEKTKPEVVESIQLEPKPLATVEGKEPMVYLRRRVTYRIIHTVTAEYEFFNGKEDQDVVVTVDENFGEHKLLGTHGFTRLDAVKHTADFLVGHTGENRKRIVEFTVQWEEKYTTDEQQPDPVPAALVQAKG